MKKLENNACALLIGVGSYRSFDPTGGRDLPGSVNDVRAWWKVCLALGIRPENVRVLASPKPEASEFPGAMVDEATHDKILAGASWLAAQLHHHPGRGGLLTFSGHGDHTADDLALCPTDTTATGNRVAFGTLGDILHSEGAADNLTMVLDCCYAGAAAKKAHPLALNDRELPPSIVRGFAHSANARPLGRTTALGPVPVGGRMLMACELNQVAHQAAFMGEIHGAFTWALTSALLQWAVVPEGSSTRLSLSYGRARSAAEALLAAFAYDQRPTLSPPAAADFAMFQTGEAPQPTSSAPDGRRLSLELDPGTKSFQPYSLTSAQSSLTAYNIATGTSSYSSTDNGRAYDISATSEYWNMPSSLLSTIQGASTVFYAVTLTPGTAAFYPSSGAITNFSNVTVINTTNLVSNLTWVSKGTAGPTGIFYDTTTQVGIGFNNITLSGGNWGGTWDWWYVAPSAPTSAIISSSGAVTYHYIKTSITAPSGSFWWQAQASISSVFLP